MNITFDDISPAFRWIDGTPGSNASAWHRLYGQDGFYAQTFHHTNTPGTSMELTFNGTAIYLYGRKQNNPAGYSTFTLDDGPSLNYTDTPIPGAGYNELLFAHTGLDSGTEHVLKWFGHPAEANGESNATAFLIDYAVITLPATGTIYSTVIDDESTMWKYSGDAWRRPAAPSDTYYNLTQHSTKGADSVQMSFRGTSVGVYGPIGPGEGNFSVSLDGVDQGTFSGTYPNEMRPVTLFVASGLEDTTHLIEIRNIPLGNSQNWFGLDYAVVNSSAVPSNPPGGTATIQSPAGVGIGAPDPSSSPSSISPGSSSSAPVEQTTGVLDPTGVLDTTAIADGEPLLDNGVPSNPTALSTSPSKHTSVPTSTILGAVIGSVLGLALFAIVIIGFLCYRKRGKRNSIATSSAFVDLSGGESKPEWRPTPFPPPTPNPNHPGATPTPAFYYSPALSNSRTGPTDGNPFNVDAQHAFLRIPPPPASSRPSNYPYSVNPPSSSDGDDEYQNPFFGRSPPATPSSRQGAASRAPSVPSTIASSLSPLSPSSLPYNRRPSRPDNPAPLSSSASTMGSIRRSYQLWTSAISGNRGNRVSGPGAGSITPTVPSVSDSPATDRKDESASRPMQARQSSEAIPHLTRPIETSDSSGTLSDNARVPRKSAGVDVPLSARPTSSVVAFSDRIQKPGREIDGGPVGVEEEAHGPLDPPDYEQATEPPR